MNFREQYNTLEEAVLIKFNSLKRNIAFNVDDLEEEVELYDIIDDLTGVDFVNKQGEIVFVRLAAFELNKGFIAYNPDNLKQVNFGFNELASLDDKIKTLELFEY